MKTLRLIFFLILPAIGLAAAQETTPSSISSSKRNLRIAAMAPLSNVYYEAGSQRIDIYAAPGSFTEPLPQPKDKVLRLFQDLPLPPNAPPDAKPPRQEVGSIELPEASKLLVILLPPAPEALDKTKIRGRAYKDSYRDHPVQVARVFNVSPKEVGIRCGKDSLQLPVGESGYMPFLPVAFNCASFQIATKDKNTWKLEENGELPAPAGYRFFVFVVETIDAVGDHHITSSAIADPMPEKPEE